MLFKIRKAIRSDKFEKCLFIFGLLFMFYGIIRIFINPPIQELIIFLIFFIGIKNIVQIRTIDFYQMKNNWILSMLIYNSYNFILLMPVLISLKKQITKEKNIKKVSILVTIIILILSISIFFLLLYANIKEI